MLLTAVQMITESVNDKSFCTGTHLVKKEGLRPAGREKNAEHAARGREPATARRGALFQTDPQRANENPRGIFDSCAHSPALFPFKNRMQPGCSVGRNLPVKWRRMAHALWGFVIEFLRRRFDWGINDRVTRSLFTRQVNARMTDVGSFHLHRFRRLMATQL